MKKLVEEYLRQINELIQLTQCMKKTYKAGIHEKELLLPSDFELVLDLIIDKLIAIKNNTKEIKKQAKIY